jgi:Na+/H+ antiporter NhaD/arsenite permease-like protein
MIGSAVGLSFMDFVVNLAPIVVVIFLVNIFILKIVFKHKMHATDEQKRRVMNMDESVAINDKKLLIKGGFVMLVTIAGFMLHAKLGFESATVALFGASLYLLISHIDPEDVLLDVEWPTIFFFASLFILVGALEDVGVIEFLAEKMVELTKGDVATSSVVILFGSSIASAFLDNIPFVATMIPLLQNFGLQTGQNIDVLWWALALGACLGGNGTLVGASANVIASGIVEKHGKKLSFMAYFKVGFPIMIVSVVLSYAYIVIRYL